MANGVAAPQGGGQGQVDIGQVKANAEKDFQQQLALLDLQRQISSQNTLMQALTTIEKGKDDVLKSIANNMK